MSDKHPNEDVPIVVLKSAGGRACSAADRMAISRVVKEKLLLTSMEPYQKAQVEVRVTKDGNPKALVVSLLRAYTYTADRVRINVDRNYAVRSIERESAGD